MWRPIRGPSLLIGEESYFADATLFRAKQKEALGAKIAEYSARGWDVVTLEDVSHFPDYEYRRVGKKKGGRTYVALTPFGRGVVSRRLSAWKGNAPA